MIVECHRAEFDASVDDVVDTSIRYLRASEAGRAARRKELNRSTLIHRAEFLRHTRELAQGA